MPGVNVSIGADSKKAQRELSLFERKVHKTAQSISKGFKERIGHKLFDGFLGAARQVPAILGESVNLASSMNEELGKSELIFGKASKGVIDWAKTTDTSLGLSELAALRVAGTFGGMFTTLGKGQEEAAEMSKEMAALAVDFGSLYDTSTEDAISAIGSALRGEVEPIRKYNILLDEWTLKQKALEKGLWDGKGALTPAMKAMAAYNVIIEKGAIANDNFADTSHGLANQKKILAAQFENLKISIGEGLLPVMTDLVSSMNDLDFEQIGKDIGAVAQQIIGWADEVRKAFVGFRVALRYVTLDWDGAKNLKDEESQRLIDRDPSSAKNSLTKEAKILMNGSDEEKKELLDRLDKEAEGLEKKKELEEETTREIEKQKALHEELLKVVDRYKSQGKDISLAEAESLVKGAKNIITGQQISEIPEYETNFFTSVMEDLVVFGQKAKDGFGGVSFDNQNNRNTVRDSIFNLGGQSATPSVSSMQSIGGGGGFQNIGEALAKKQAELLQRLVDLEEQKTSTNSISDF